MQPSSDMLGPDTLDKMNQRFGIADHIHFLSGAGGLTVVEMRSAEGASAKVALHGAHVLSYCPPPADKAASRPSPDLLFVSQKSWWEPEKPIRGGIPVCFPWFGPHPRQPDFPAHGFARLFAWKVRNTAVTDDGCAELTLALKQDGHFRKWFNHEFVTQITVRVGHALELEMMVKNLNTPGPDDAFTFEQALHTYFRVADIRTTTVQGLQGTRYLDKVGEPAHRQDDAPSITFTGETDRVYHQTDATCMICEAGCPSAIEVAKTGSKSTVVWNPWIEKAARMPDYGDDEWPGMVCVETANVGPDAVTLRSGESHTMTLTVRPTLPQDP